MLLRSVERHTSGPPKRQYVETAPRAGELANVVVGLLSFCCTCKPSYAYGEVNAAIYSYHIRPRQKEMCTVMVREHAPFRWPFLFRVWVWAVDTRACMCTQYNVRLDVCDSLYLELHRSRASSILFQKKRERRLSVRAVQLGTELTGGEWFSVPGRLTTLNCYYPWRPESEWRWITAGRPESDTQTAVSSGVDT